MKNRRRIIVAFMLCAVMLLGIGYAAVTTSMKIDGSAHINAGNVQAAFDTNVYFSDAIALQNTEGTNPDMAWVDTVDNDIANFKSVNLSKQGDTALLRLQLQTLLTWRYL